MPYLIPLRDRHNADALGLSGCLRLSLPTSLQPTRAALWSSRPGASCVALRSISSDLKAGFLRDARRFCVKLAVAACCTLTGRFLTPCTTGVNNRCGGDESHLPWGHWSSRPDLSSRGASRPSEDGDLNADRSGASIWNREGNETLYKRTPLIVDAIWKADSRTWPTPGMINIPTTTFIQNLSHKMIYKHTDYEASSRPSSVCASCKATCDK